MPRLKKMALWGLGLCFTVFLVAQGDATKPLPGIHDHPPTLPAFVGQTAFEDLCRAWVVAKGDAGQLPVVPQRVGRWWDRHAEVDVVASILEIKPSFWGKPGGRHAPWAPRPLRP